MPMLLIKGSFHLSGRSKPDGDTIPFAPDYVGEWKLVQGCRKPVPGANGTVGVRLEGVDALETHYEGPYGGEEVRQPGRFPHAAANELLAWLGFPDVQRGPDEAITAVPASVPGYILTRGTDTYGRCVALVGRGAPPMASGYEVNVKVEHLRRTANHHLLTQGLAYPTFYEGLPKDLRLELVAAAQQARAALKGLWPSDATMRGGKIIGMASIIEEGDVVLLPKLFRRLKDHFSSGAPSLAGFPTFLAGAADRFRILSTDKEVVGLHNVVEITNEHTLRMTRPIEDLLFEEK
ncbi:nuclease [Streptomyces sp. SAJ15]|uniref:nuclease n=1 Tax=Streptomyces sp. SAJ15 TaxID=2011095 RepID=UPI001186353B|nr:nuclease [Streptomyces sp. SAJ15]TVL91626.1 nuclease [Streptomyces sp. SAJ15]